MDKKIVLTYWCGVFLIFSSLQYVQTTVELRIPTVPPITTIVSRITSTTFGIFRGGINIFNRTVDRIINTFGRVEDRLRQLLEEFRKQIVRGIPELSIPILDPLHIDKIDFNILHEAIKIKGHAEDITVKYISKFVVDKQRFSDLGNLRFKLDLNLTFPYIRINGKYKVNGNLEDQFIFYGDGKFWANLIDFKLAISAIIKFEYTRLKMIALNLNIKLGSLENNFENLMGDPEVGDLINKVISKMAPEALDIIWPDIKGSVEDEILQYVNKILENATVTNLARRLFNIV